MNSRFFRKFETGRCGSNASLLMFGYLLSYAKLGFARYRKNNSVEFVTGAALDWLPH